MYIFNITPLGTTWLKNNLSNFCSSLFIASTRVAIMVQYFVGPKTSWERNWSHVSFTLFLQVYITIKFNYLTGSSGGYFFQFLKKIEDIPKYMVFVSDGSNIWKQSSGFVLEFRRTFPNLFLNFWFFDWKFQRFEGHFWGTRSKFGRFDV